MKVFRFVFARAVIGAVFLAAVALHAAEVSVSSGAVRVQLGASASQRIAVDVSSNLTNWAQLTNVAPSGSEISFANDISALSDPARFFRLADGDETFAIAGYVDGGSTFGGVAGATVQLNPSGATTMTDANGFFHFDARYGRSALPMTVSVVSTNFSGSPREITALDAGTFSILRVSPPSPGQPAPGATYHFHTTGGPRAGTDFAVSFTNSQFTLSGAFTGVGGYTIGASGLINLTFNAVISQMRLWIPGDATNGVFAGIPSSTGTLSGNGTVTVQLPPAPVVSPNALNGKTFTMTTASADVAIAFADTTFTSTPAIFANPTGTVSQSGDYNAVRDANVWMVTLFYAGAESQLTFTFQTASGGIYVLARPGAAQMTGQFTMTDTPVVQTYPAPASLSHVYVHATESIAGTTEYVIEFSGGASGGFVVTPGVGLAGTYTYAPSGSSAHLHLDYQNDFAGDYDDMTLQFTAPDVASFTGTQRANSSVYPFTGFLTLPSTGTTTSTGTSTSTGSTSTGTTGAIGTSTSTGTTTSTGDSTSTGTTTSTGSSSSTGTTSGTGTFATPTTLTHISFNPTQSFSGATPYQVNLSGGAAGTFAYPNDPNLYGTFTYTVTDNVPHLVMRYAGPFQGDFDDITLHFVGEPGSNVASTFSGTQSVNNLTNTFTGTFTYSN